MPFRRMPFAAVLVAGSVASAPVAYAQSWPQQQEQQTSAWPQSSPKQQSSARQQSNPWQQQQQQQQQQEQQPANSCAAFLPLKSDAEKTVVALNAAQKKKAPREEFCQLFKHLSDATGKMLRFFEKHKEQCRVPSEAIVAIRNDHNKTLAMQKQACGTGTAAPTAAPSLSDVLSSPILPDSSVARPNVGTFDTMTGNPLIR